MARTGGAKAHRFIDCGLHKDSHRDFLDKCSPYGLTSAIYTRDQERAERFAAAADIGMVHMNRCDYLDPALTWTGVRDGGRGTSLSKYGFYAMTRRKAIQFRVG